MKKAFYLMIVLVTMMIASTQVNAVDSIGVRELGCDDEWVVDCIEDWAVECLPLLSRQTRS